MKNGSLLVGCGVLAWLWLIAVCARDWTASQDYRYGWAVPVLAAYFLFKRLPLAGGGESSRRLRTIAGAMLAVAVLAVGPLEALRLVPLPWRLVTWAIFGVVVLITLAVALLKFGTKGLTLAAFPCLFLATAVPWPAFLEVNVSLPAMYAVAAVVTELLRLLGVPAVCAGTQIVMSNQAIGIEEACSGLRSLQAAVMTALACGEIFRLRFPSRLFLLAVALPAALAANVLRSLALALAGNEGGARAVEHWHGTAGWLALLVVVAIIGLLATLLRSGSEITPAPHQQLPTMPIWAQSALLCAGIAGFLTANLWFVLHGTTGGASAPLIKLHNDERLVTEEPPANVLSILHPTEGKYARTSLGENGSAVAYHFYWAATPGNAVQLYHRPDVCMPGAGWTLAGMPRRLHWPPGDPVGYWQVIPYERGAQRASLIWGGWLDGKPFEIDLTAEKSLQWRVMFQLMRNGRRSLTYEVAAVLAPADQGWLTDSQAADMLSAFFFSHADPARR